MSTALSESICDAHSDVCDEVDNEDKEKRRTPLGCINPWLECEECQKYDNASSQCNGQEHRFTIIGRCNEANNESLAECERCQNDHIRWRLTTCTLRARNGADQNEAQDAWDEDQVWIRLKEATNALVV